MFHIFFHLSGRVLVFVYIFAPLIFILWSAIIIIIIINITTTTSNC